MTFYRVALEVNHASTRSGSQPYSVSLEAVFGWLRMHRALPQERLRVFSSPSREELDEHWRGRTGTRLHSGDGSALPPGKGNSRTCGGKGGTSTGNTHVPGDSSACCRHTTVMGWEEQKEDQSCTSRACVRLERKREEFERGTGGDHDTPYRFTLPTSMPQVLAWVKLLVRVHDDELQP